MKKILKWMAGILAVIIIGLGIASFPTLMRGYRMYQDAVEQCSLSDKVAEIQSRSDYITLDEVPLAYQKSLLHSEDRRFYLHAGVDPIALVRAVFNDIKAGSYVQGGSTIDQQLARHWTARQPNCLSYTIWNPTIPRMKSLNSISILPITATATTV